MAFSFNKPFMVSIFILYEAYTAMITRGERVFIAEISPKKLKRTILGRHSTIVGIVLFTSVQ
jgi:hypothetical protein